MRYLILVLLGGALAACVSAPVRVLPGGGDRATWLVEHWQGRVELAMQHYRALAFEQTGLRSPPQPEVVLATTSAQASSASVGKQTHVAVMNSFYAAQLHEQGVVGPVRTAARMLQDTLAGGRATQAPYWLRDGLASEMANAVLRRMQTDTLSVQDRLDDAAVQLRRSSPPVLVAALLRETAARGGAVEEALSAFMVQHLRSRVGGEQLDRVWASYFRELSSGRPADVAFAQAFGVSLTDFGQSAEAALARLRAESRAHAQHPALPPVLDEQSAPQALDNLPSDAARRSFEAYRKLPTPKAFAVSRNGGWTSYSDAANAIERSLRQCRSIDPVGCALFAVDERIVYGEQQGTGSVDIIFNSKADDAWAQQVRERWMPVLRDTTERFTQAVRAHLGVELRQRALIHVVPSREDYARVLREDMRQISGNATRTAESSSGYANQRGQMIVSLLPTYTQDLLWNTVVRLTLHELTHELQGQLQRHNRGFQPQRWLEEGSADQIAALVARSIPRDAAARYDMDDFREHSIEWYRLVGRSAAPPESLVNVSFRDWLKLASEGKGPYQMSSLMVLHLEDLLGKAYYPALVKYWGLAAQAGQKHDEAFESAFGRSPAAFMASFKAWLQVLGS